MKKFYIEILGCPMRAIEGQRLRNYFVKNGFKEVKAMDQADLIAVFTCSVVDDTEKRSIDFLDELKGFKGEILLMGCSPAMSPELFSQHFNGIMISTKNLEDEIDSYFPDFTFKFNEIQLPSDYQVRYPYGQHYLNQYKHKKRGLFGKEIIPAVIVTSKGCNHACSYCTMRRALGAVKSYDEEMILENYRSIRNNNDTIVIFNGDDTGAYGIDVKKSFGDLLDKCYEEEQLLLNKRKKNKVEWILDNLHPYWFNLYFEVILKYAKMGIIAKMVVPMQSASNGILKSMKRKYSVEGVKEKLIKIKKEVTNLKIQTHFIIGYPGEVHQDIVNIIDLIETGVFNSVILLKYFEAENSDSAKLSNKVDPEVVEKRVKILSEWMENNNVEYLIDGVIS